MFHIQIHEEIENENGLAPNIAPIERFSVRVDDDPSKAIMRLLSAEKRGPKNKPKVTPTGKEATK